VSIPDVQAHDSPDEEAVGCLASQNRPLSGVACDEHVSCCLLCRPLLWGLRSDEVGEASCIITKRLIILALAAILG